MSALNNVNIMGYVRTNKDNDPIEVRQVGSGDKTFSTCRFQVAVPRDRKDKDGKKIYDYINVSAIGATAEFIGKYFNPGDVIAIQGELHTRTYKDKDGNNKSAWEVQVTGAAFPISKNNEGGNRGAAKASAPAAKPTAPTVGPDDFEEIEGDDDLPF